MYVSSKITYENPRIDIGKSSPDEYPLWKRKLIGSTLCAVHGHDYSRHSYFNQKHGSVSGYANSHLYSWHDYRSGSYVTCARCNGRRFTSDLTKKQIAEILRIETKRWTTFCTERALNENSSLRR